ncbi:MAG: DUF58 domain-containing protein [Thermoprotei archaeon]|nr:DUF58 domain-containing protein [Thermoprotei archaeon]
MVQPTYKGFLALFIAVSLIASGAFDILYPFSTATGIALTIMLAFLYFNVSRLAASLGKVKASRIVEPETVVEGLEARVNIVLSNESPEDLKLTVVDTPPPRTFTGGIKRFLAEVKGGGSVKITYGVRGAPGRHEWSVLLLELSDPLGFFVEPRGLEVMAALRVVPSYFKIEDIVADKIVGISEAYSRLNPGESLEFYEIREYVWGDDPRKIAWLASAREGKLMVRDFRKELRYAPCLILDLSRGSWYGPVGESPGDWIVRVSTAISALVARSGGTLSYIIYDGATARKALNVRGWEGHESLSSRLAGFDPLKSHFHVYVPNLLREASESCGFRPVILLAGPETLMNTGSSLVLEVAPELRGRLIILAFAPSSLKAVSGDMLQALNSRILELSRDMEVSGVRVLRISNAGDAAVGLMEVARVTAF